MKFTSHLRRNVRLVFFSFGLSLSLLVSAGAASHKLRVTDPAERQQLVAQGAKLIADYGSYQLFESSAADPLSLRVPKAEVRDDFNIVELNAGRLDTTQPAVQALRQPLAAFKGKRLHLVQFAGPVLPEWFQALAQTGVQIIDYVPENSYLVHGDSTSLARLRQLAATTDYVQWESAYADDYKFHPQARPFDQQGNARQLDTDTLTIQLVADDESNPATLQLIDSLKLAPIKRQKKVLHFVNITVRLAPGSLPKIAAQPDVVSIHAYHEPHLLCERQDQIIAGNLTGNAPTGPGYLAWLAGKGFTQAQFDASGFVVDVSDSGIDNGTTSPNHFGLYASGARPGTSRVAYNRLEGTPNAGSTLQGCDGHGNLNSHIIAGYDNLAGAPYADASGYHFGLGVCPFVAVGSSVIFDSSKFTSPVYEDLIARAYRDGARVSNNSWGGGTFGAYDADTQTYDALVRDAQPAGSAVPVAGNQEMVIVFAAGNDGSAATTVQPPGTGKNTIVVGAGENVQAFGGADGSGISDSGANSANDIISFSSRGPCSDGRFKPDLCAPGTHVSGGVAQTANPGPLGTANSCYDGSGVSGGPGGSSFFPTNQQFYTASSGTSHSTPAVAGGCALIRQYFINNFGGPPSPAMTKAYLLNSARYMTGTGAGGTLPSNSQGMGGMNLGTAFDGAPRFLRDQVVSDLLTNSGATRVFTGTVGDSGKPFRVTLAWTDAPGSTTGNAYKNNLDLTVTVGGNTYKGNVFSGQYSTTGGTADAKNNVENVFLAAGVSGVYTVTVTATSINSDGVPGNATALDQDFALVIYNATQSATPLVVTPASGLSASGNTGGPFSPASQVYTLSNTGTSNLNWTASNTASWLTLSATSGALAAGTSTNVTIAINTNANSLPANTYSDTVAFTNTTSGDGNTTRAVTLTVNAITPVIVANGATLVAEGCLSTNGAIDPGETVTVNFALKNTGTGPSANLVATLLATGGVTNPSSPQSYGLLATNGTPITQPFSFMATGTCGGALTATLQLQDGTNNLGKVTFNFTLGALSPTITNNYSSGGLTTAIPDVSTIDVPISVTDTGTVTDVNVRVRLNHTYDSDLVISLVHPDGTVVALSTNHGSSGDNYGSGAANCSGTFTVFDDAAATAISAGIAPFAGAFRPDAALSAFNGKPSQGTWKLRITDTTANDTGTVYCAQLQIAQQAYVCCGGAALPPQIVSAGASLSNESCVATNGAIDPGETVTVNFALQNVGAGNASNVVATLGATGGVSSPSAPQSYGALAAGGGAVSQPFTFTAAGSCGGTVTAVLQLQDGASNLGNITNTFTLGANLGGTLAQTNATSLTIPGSGTGATTGAPASLYPSTVSVAGVVGTVTKVTVTLLRLAHTYPDDIDVLLVGPTGQSIILMSDVGGGTDITNVTITLDDAAASSLPDSSIITSGTYKPTNIGSGDAFPAPAATNALVTTLAAFNGLNPNGTWSLYVVDDASADTGLMGGWALNLTTVSNVCCAGLANQPPVVTNAFITPGAPTTTNSLIASAFASDPDGDPVSFAYQWQESTNNTAFGNMAFTASTLPASATVAGDFYRVVIIPNDGIANGAPFTTGSVLVPVDADGNGINDDWEVASFGRIGVDPNVDPDGDGLTTLQEFLAGTDPTNSTSCLCITSIAIEGTDLRVTWTTGAGRTNALQQSAGANFSTNGFADLFVVTNTTGAATNYLDRGAATNLPARYYRVRLRP